MSLNTKLTEIRIAGFGGQGVILAANIVGKAASIQAGGYATLTQNYGPEARGGASSAALVLSDEPVLYPYTTKLNVLVVMSQEALSKFVPELAGDGLLLVEQDLVRLEELPDSARVYGIPATRLAEELGKRIVTNIVMLGFLASKTDIMPVEAYKRAIAESVPAAARELNMKAFDTGYEYGLKAEQISHEDLLTVAEAVVE
ncbi:MAG: 2-oxoacid:acceptor oxidoreductase family protein [Bryobacterales bacterium]|nr:2-oxoacid:acceptor oxidoreductase family protein [Bryobacterales bacterium]